MLRVTTSNIEFFAHNTLWTTANKHINYAALHPQGAFYDYLTAMLLSGLTLESYLNFIGNQLSHMIWAKKHYFSSSLLQKSRTVLNLCALPLISELDEPCATIVRLDALRDKISSGKTMTVIFAFPHGSNDDQDLGKLLSAKVDVNRECALSTLKNTEAFIGYVHRSAAKVLQDPKVTAARLSLNTGYRSHSAGAIS